MLLGLRWRLRVSGEGLALAGADGRRPRRLVQLGLAGQQRRTESEPSRPRLAGPRNDGDAMRRNRNRVPKLSSSYRNPMVEHEPEGTVMATHRATKFGRQV